MPQHHRPSGPGTRGIVLALCAGYFLVLLDVTVVNVALPAIGDGMGLAGAGLAWVVDAYAIPLAALLLAAGSIGDRIGHRTVVLVGFCGFAAASVVCALAPSAGVLIAGRAVQGAAAAFSMPGTLAMLTLMAPGEAARSRMVGLWAAVGGAALPAGPLIGGVVVSWWGWRPVFWLNVPVIATALLILGRRHRDRGEPRAATRRGEVDWAGAGLLTVTIAAGVTAIITSATDLAVAAVAAAVAALGLAAFVLAERRAEDPLLRVERRGRAPLVVACTVAGVMNLCSLGALFLLTQLFQSVHGLSALHAGLLLLPAFLPLPLLGTPAGRLTNRLGPWRTSQIGLLVGAAGLMITASQAPHPIGPLLIVGLALWGIGLGILTPGVVAAALHATPGTPGAASGASNTARQLGGAIGVAAFAVAAGPANHGAFAPHTRAALLGAGAAFVAAALGITAFTGRGHRVA